MIITIDGPAGSGKSSVARKLAKKIRFTFFDSGAMYRALTYFIMENKIHYNDEQELEKALKNFSYRVDFSEEEEVHFIHKKNVNREIRSIEVTNKVSEISALVPVRKALISLQRNYAKNTDAVFEGRDMGSTVFPNAELKIFLSADPNVRAQRRLLEMQEKNPEKAKKVSLEEIYDNIVMRDHLDSTRAYSPLRQAEDSYFIDTSHLSMKEVVDKIVEYKNQSYSSL